MGKNELHVGRGTTRGAMTVFPLWSAGSGSCRYTLDPTHLDVSEVNGDPDVGTLLMGNTGDRPVLVLEGQLFEGGWQHRMSLTSLMVGVGQRIPVVVACVEEGRWGGSTQQHSRGRRATPYVRDAARGVVDVQTEVWSRVASRTAGAPNATGSLVNHMDAEPRLDAWRDHRPLPGQCGVLIGIGGQPYVAEVFDSAVTLRRQLLPILEAAWLDAGTAPVVATPGRRARRFVERYEALRVVPQGPAGVGEHHAARSDRLDVARLQWDGRDVHTRISHVRHPMLVGVE